MNEKAILEQLEGLARNLGINIRYETIDPDESFGVGGLCRLRGETFLIIHTKASAREKIQTFARALQGFDLDSLHMRPFIREFLTEFSKR